MFTNNRQFSFGTDPEVFLFKEKAFEKEHYFWSAHGIIPGNKTHPFKVPFGAIQVDGTAAEFNIDPVTTLKDFVHNITSVLSTLKYKYAQPNGLKIVATPVAYFDEKYYHSLPTEVKELGCNPDWNAYTGKVNPRPKEPDDLFRTGSGHIHIGWGNDFNTDDPNLLEACCHVVKHLDTCVGKPLSSNAFASHQSFHLRYLDHKRRSLYGDYGAFRPTKYGVEYRSPSNVWLSDKRLIPWVYENTCYAIHKAFNSTRYNYTPPKPPSI